jgi:hypothetical protein
MAIPTDLWKVEYSGSWHKVNYLPPQEKLADWSMTYFCTFPVSGFNSIIANNIHQILEAVWGLGSSQNWWGPAFWLTYQKVIHVNTGMFLDYSTAYQLGTASTQWKALPFQTAVLAWGNAQDLRHQVRHWFPGWNDLISNPDGTVKDAYQDNLDGWCKLWFTPQSNVFWTITPVVWDAENEVVRQIHSVHRQSAFRTIRRRAVKSLGEVRDL